MMPARSASQTADADEAVYVYGVARNAPAAWNAPLIEGIIPGAPVELRPVGELAIVMNRAGRAAFAPPGNEAENPGEWATARALAHHRVLASLSAFCTVAPVKFGALCRGLDDVLALFGRSGASFIAALDRVEGAREWSVKLFADVETRRAAAEAAPTMAALKTEMAAASPGRAFFMRKQQLAAVEQELRQELAGEAENLHNRIAACAREAAPGPALQQLGAAPSRQGTVLVLDSAFLIEKTREAEFHSVLGELHNTLATRGLTIKLTGPWPPYSFVTIDTGGEADGTS